MIFRSLLLGAVLVGAGCFDFDPDTDRFVCSTDDECVSGYVCAGHTLRGNKAVSYCVVESEATAGVALFIAQGLFSCTVFGAEGIGGVDWELAVGAYPAVTDPVDLTPGAPPMCTGDGAPDAPCCVGEPGGNGGGRIVCMAPRADVAKMAVSVRYLRSSDRAVLATISGEKVIPASGAPLAQLEVFSFDLDEPGDRCTQRALPREQVCGSTIDCACADASACPPGYTCNGTSCAPPQ